MSSDDHPWPKNTLILRSFYRCSAGNMIVGDMEPRKKENLSLWSAQCDHKHNIEMSDSQR